MHKKPKSCGIDRRPQPERVLGEIRRAPHGMMHEQNRTQ